MNFFDCAFIVFAALLIAIGIKRGLISEAFRLLAMVAGFVGASVFYRKLYGYFTFIKPSPGIRLVISFITVYAVIAILLLITGWLLRKAVRLVMLGWIDRLCGGLIGLVKAIIVAWVIVLAVSVLPLKESRRGIDTSWTFMLLRALPLALHIPDIDTAQKSLRRVIDPEAIETLRTTRDKLGDFRTRVDSIKNRMDTP